MVQGHLRLPVESPQLTRVGENGHISAVRLQPADWTWSSKQHFVLHVMYLTSADKTWAFIFTTQHKYTVKLQPRCTKFSFTQLLKHNWWWLDNNDRRGASLRGVPRGGGGWGGCHSHKWPPVVCFELQDPSFKDSVLGFRQLTERELQMFPGYS